MKRKTICSVFAAAIAMTASGAMAETVTYNFTIDLPGGNPVDSLILYAKGAGSEDVYVSPVSITTSGAHTLTHTVPFDVTEALILGTNVSDIDHIIMFANSEFAYSSIGYKWSELFPQANGNPRHSVMFDTIHAAADGDAAALATVTNFLHGSDAEEAMFNPHSSQYAIMAYSVVLPPIGTPEPASLSVLGLGAAALLMRRRK